MNKLQLNELEPETILNVYQLHMPSRHDIYRPLDLNKLVTKHTAVIKHVPKHYSEPATNKIVLITLDSDSEAKARSVGSENFFLTEEDAYFAAMKKLKDANNDLIGSSVRQNQGLIKNYEHIRSVRKKQTDETLREIELETIEDT
jgi:hypothetical protein